MESCGKPFAFCSRDEVLRRQETEDVHILEATLVTRHLPPSKRIIDPCLAVRKFFRSGTENLHVQKTGVAGSSVSAHRSYQELCDTMKYLLVMIWDCEALYNIIEMRYPSSPDVFEFLKEEVGLRYGFIMNRVDAIRQDIVMFREMRGSSSIIVTNTGDQYDLFAVLDLQITILRFYIHAHFVISKILAIFSTHENSELSKPHEIAPWFDWHLHQSAISFCLSSALHVANDCREIIRCQGYESIRESKQISLKKQYDELCAYYLLFNQAVTMKVAFKDIATLNFPVGSLVNTKILDSLSKNSTSDFVHCLQERLKFAELSEESELVYSDCVVELLHKLRAGNPAGVYSFLLALQKIIALQPEQRHEIGGLYYSDHCPIACLLGLVDIMIPELRIWRILLSDRAANKAEILTVDSVLKRIWNPIMFEDRGEESLQRLCNCLSIPYDLEKRSITLKNSPVCDVVQIISLALESRNLFSISGSCPPAIFFGNFHQQLQEL